jgi:hypothetical protein
MNALMNTRRSIRRAAAHALWMALAGLASAAPVAAQERAAEQRPPLAMATVRAGAEPVREAGQWDLPRLFYEPRQRRVLDAQDRAQQLGLNAAAPAPAGPRFDGWLSGPTGTHAWISGARYRADGKGHLQAAGDHVADADAGADDMAGANVQLDRTRGVLVVHREAEGTLHLRVGEAEYPASVPMAGEAAPAVAGPDRR